jgi:anti-sigma regulatory factor (Ser/Thr protein kinase)
MGDVVETSLSVAADREAMAKIRSLIDQFGASHAIAGEDIARVIIAVEELVTNTVKYGYAPGAAPGSATFTLRLEDSRLSIEYVDDAHEFNPFATPDPDFEAPIEARRVGGLGLHIVRALMDRTAYRREGGRNIMELSRPVTIVK